MEQDYDRIFYDYVTIAEDMDPLKAMKLLTKACMNYQCISKNYSTMYGVLVGKYDVLY